MSKKTQRERRERQFRMNVAIIAGVLVVIMAIGIGGLVWFLQTNRANEPTAKTESEEAVSARITRADEDGKLRDNATVEAQKGDIKKVEQLYAQVIASEGDKVRKIQLYVDQSGVLYTAGKYSEAFEVAKQAEGLSSDKFLVADWLSRIYEDQKDYVNAVKYYRLAGQSADSSQNQTGITKDMYDKEAERVSKLMSGTGR